MKPSTAETGLKWLLRYFGGMASLAFPFMLMPKAWLAGMHEGLGLGAFPEQPIAEYLARATSGMCGVYGLLVLMMSTDIKHYARMIRFQAWVVLILSLVGGYLTWCSGLPLWWPIIDSGGAAFCCALMLWLQRQSKEGLG